MTKSAPKTSAGVTPPQFATSDREPAKLTKVVHPDGRISQYPPPEVWDNYWINVYNKFERGIGWLIFSIGAVILLTYGGFKFVESVINDPGLAFAVKFGIFLAIGGLAVLFVSVAREKFFTRRHDPYKEIVR